MNYQSFLDHIGLEGCIFLPEFSGETESIYRNIYNGYEGSLTPDPVWISYIHAIAFCIDMDIEIPANLMDRMDDYNALGF